MTSVCQRNLIFVIGKGGVGKTVLSQALALALSRPLGKRVLWACFEDPGRPTGELVRSPFNAGDTRGELWLLNAESMQSFEEYAELKIEKLGSKMGFLGGALGSNHLTRAFVNNKLIRYLAKAAPGIHELVLLGKVWHERTRYDHVVVDMPSTGYGVAMFQSAVNFSRLFGGGPLANDAEAMLSTFQDPGQTGHLILALPEEMPLREALELDQMLKGLFPKNEAAFIANRVFPHPGPGQPTVGQPTVGQPDDWPSPFASSLEDYALKRSALETYNFRLWNEALIPYSKLDFVPPRLAQTEPDLVRQMALQLREKGLVLP